MRNDDDLLTMAARVDPVPPEAFSGLAASPEGQRIFASVVDARVGRHARSSRRLVAVAALTAVVMALVVATRPDPDPRLSEPKWSPALVALAQESPRLLIHAEGWRVARADEFSGGQGEMFFENGRRCSDAGRPEDCDWMSLAWYPVESYRHYLADRRRGADGSWKIEIDGHDAVLFRHDAPPPDPTPGIGGDPFTGTTFYALWVDGGHWLELRSDVIPVTEEFRSVAATVHSVDVDTWLAALPPSVVQSYERPGEIDRILADVPVPAGFDLDELAARPGVRNEIETEVVTAVVCGWIDQWIEGRRSGNADAVTEAVEALAGARHWAVYAEHGQSELVVSEIADAMPRAEPVYGDGSLPPGVQYQRQMGCEEG